MASERYSRRDGDVALPHPLAFASSHAAASILAAAAAIAAFVCLTGAVSLLAARPTALTSDEALYHAESVNIANGRGPEYTTGRPVVHRPFLFPAILAAERVGLGRDIARAYWLPRLATLAAAALLGMVAWRTAGSIAGVGAAGLAASNAYANSLGNSLYVDGTETALLLVALLALVPLIKRPSPRACALAGLALAAAFWTKESALLWLPLPFVALAFVQRPLERRDAAALAAYSIFAGLPLAAWWVWVDRHGGGVFLAGHGPSAIVWAVVAAPAAAAAAFAGAAAAMRRPLAASGPRRVGGALLVAAWCALWLWALETHSWPHPHAYVTSIPRYVWSVGPNVQPFFLVAPAWAYVAWRAWRGSEGARLLCAAAALYLPFALFAANRGLALRDALPLVYLTLAALAIFIVDATRVMVARAADGSPGAAARAAAVLAAAFVVAAVALPQVRTFRDANAAFDPAQVREDNWDNPLARRLAAWVDANVEPGTPLMTSRLYHSSIFSMNDGRYPVHQLPTLRVQFDGTALRPMSTQFRWEDDRLAGSGEGSWLYLRRYPQKGYYVGLAQGDLLGELRASGAGYLVLAGEDAAYSSFSYLDYLLLQPGLQLVHVEPAAENQAFIFRVDASRLAPLSFPVTISATTDAALRQALGDDYDAAIAALGPAARASGEHGLPVAARWLLAAADQPH